MFNSTITNSPDSIAFDSLPDQPLDWLWQDRLPRRHLTLLAAPPGTGKTSFALHLAAQLSRSLPLGPTPQNPAPTPAPAPNPAPTPTPQIENRKSQIENPPATLLLSPDSPSSLLPTLHALHADLHHLHLLPDFHSLAAPDAFDTLDQAVRQIPNLALLIFDPISSFLGTDYNAHPRLLRWLARFAHDHNLAILLTAPLPRRHIPNPLHALHNPTLLLPLLTALPHASSARVVHFLLPTFADLAPPPAPSPPIENQKSKFENLLFTPKSTFTAPPAPLAFSLHPALAWQPLPASFGIPPISPKPLDPLAQWAAEWLRGTLENGPEPASMILAQARHLQFPQRALAHAKAHLHVRSLKQSFTGTWFWQLPDDPRPLPEDPAERRYRRAAERRAQTPKPRPPEPEPKPQTHPTPPAPPIENQKSKMGGAENPPSPAEDPSPSSFVIRHSSFSSPPSPLTPAITVNLRDLPPKNTSLPPAPETPTPANCPDLQFSGAP